MMKIFIIINLTGYNFQQGLIFSENLLKNENFIIPRYTCQRRLENA